MVIALTKFEDEIATYINKAVMMAPCFISDLAYAFGGLSTIPGFWPGAFNPLGIYVLNGPNWENDQKDGCENLPNLCPFLVATDGLKPATIKYLDHLVQNYNSGIFSEYVDNWTATNNQGKAYDLESIS